ncbi:MAG: DUF4340 domain-containing protein [Candidatus Riflebacteria bacterium]|nr:DUF4340 domain-containing protein [Candidatus Riflebacteria bacterium]
MKKRFVPTIIAVTVFLLLFAYANFYEVEPIPKAGEDNPILLSSIKLDDVKAITWKKGNSEEIKAECRSENGKTSYKLVKPHVSRGDESEFSGLLRIFEDLNSERLIANNATDTSLYGISTQSPILTIETASKTFQFTLGSTNPIGNSAYFQRDSDKAVYLVRSNVPPAFSKAFNELRSKNIFSEDFLGVNSVELINSSGTFKLEKPSSGEWKVISPKGSPADGSEVSNLIFSIHDLKASRFVEDEWDQNGKSADASATSKYEFEKPAFCLTLAETATKSWKLLVGKEENGERFVKRDDSPTVYAVPTANLAPLNKDFNSFRAKDLPLLAKTEVKSLKLRSASASFELDLASNTWTCKGRKVDSDKVNAMFEACVTNKIKEFLPMSELSKEGLERKETADKIEFVGSGKSTSILFGMGNVTQIAILIEGQEEIYRVPIQIHEAFKHLLDVTMPPVDKKAASEPGNKGAEIKAPETMPVLPSVPKSSKLTTEQITMPKPVINSDTIPNTTNLVAEKKLNNNTQAVKELSVPENRQVLPNEKPVSNPVVIPGLASQAITPLPIPNGSLNSLSSAGSELNKK